MYASLKNLVCRPCFPGTYSSRWPQISWPSAHRSTNTPRLTLTHIPGHMHNKIAFLLAVFSRQSVCDLSVAKNTTVVAYNLFSFSQTHSHTFPFFPKFIARCKRASSISRNKLVKRSFFSPIDDHICLSCPRILPAPTMKDERGTGIVSGVKRKPGSVRHRRTRARTREDRGLSLPAIESNRTD